MIHGTGRRLAAIFAHPDDETFAIGGTLALYAHAGAEITLFCATDGQAGKSSGVPVDSPEELGAIRRNELHAAARHLGVHDVVMGGYADGGLAAVDPERLIGDLIAFLRRVRPDVVITFGPEGAPTGHADHRALSRAVTAAYFLAGLPTECPEAGLPHRAARLYYHTFQAPKQSDRPLKLGLPPTVRVDTREWHARKREAFRLHVTQRMHERTFEELAMSDEEWFTLVSGAPQIEEVCSDIFDGL